MYVDEEVVQMLGALNQGFPAVAEMTGAEARAAVAARQVPPTNLDDVSQAQDHTIDTEGGRLPVRVYHPHGGVEPRPVTIFLHGGGFVFCDLESHDGFCRLWSKNTGNIVVSVDYRRAPEHAAPAAAEDGYAALCWAVENAADLGLDPDAVTVAGDSAGGNLAAVVCLIARERGEPAIAAQALLYPMTDPSCGSESHRKFATGYFNTEAAVQWYWQQYLSDGMPEPEYLAAPLRAPSLQGLPPAVVVTAGADPLSGDGDSYAAALADAGVRVRHRTYPGLFHGFLTILPLCAAESARQLLWHDLAETLGAGRAAS